MAGRQGCCSYSDFSQGSRKETFLSRVFGEYVMSADSSLHKLRQNYFSQFLIFGSYTQTANHVFCWIQGFFKEVDLPATKFQTLLCIASPYAARQQDRERGVAGSSLLFMDTYDIMGIPVVTPPSYYLFV
ncbi:hypothetical protein AMECASPLE_038405 [Ameca splendens]|uniref:Uncharacterized protein n=1 Tax=Ameca splendens TaxID=208324 RepID=A0ABV1A5P8_9TELE